LLPLLLSQELMVGVLLLLLLLLLMHGACAAEAMAARADKAIAGLSVPSCGVGRGGDWR